MPARDTKASRIERILMAHPEGMLAHELASTYQEAHGERLNVSTLSEVIAMRSLFVIVHNESSSNPKEYRYQFDFDLWRYHHRRPAPPDPSIPASRTCPTCYRVHNGWIRPSHCVCGTKLTKRAVAKCQLPGAAGHSNV